MAATNDERVEPVGETPRRKGYYQRTKSLVMPDTTNDERVEPVGETPTKKGYYQRTKAW